MSIFNSKLYIQFIYTLILVIALPISVYCIDNKDNIQRDLSENQQKLEYLYKQSNTLLSKNQDSAIDLAKKGLSIANTTNNIEYQIKFLKSLINTAFKTRDFKSEIIYSEQLIPVFEKTRQVKELSTIYLNISSVYGRTFNYNKAFYYIHKLIELTKKTGDLNMQAKAYSNLGTIFSVIKDYKNALIYLNKGLKIIEGVKGKESLTISLYNNIAIAYGYNKEYEKTLDFQFKSLKLIEGGKDNRQRAITLSNIGFTFTLIKKDNEALVYFLKALPYAIKENDVLLLANIFRNIGSIYLKSQKYEKAYYYLYKAEIIGKKYNNLIALKDTYESLSDYYLIKKDYYNSFRYYLMFKNTNDSLFKTQNNNKITELKVQFETNEIEKENKLLKQKEVIHVLEIQQKKLVNNLIILLSLLTSALVLLTFHRFWLKKKANKELSIKNELISNQNIKLQEVNNTKDKFFTIIGQDIKEPFFDMKHYIFELYEKFDELNPTEYKELVDNLKTKSIYASRLLENLLIWARSQRDNIEISKQKLHLQTLINDSIRNFIVPAKEKLHKTEITIPEEYHVFADKYTMEVILGNIFNNAIKFTPDNGSIIISALLINDKIEIKISDNGVGISKQRLDKIFNIGDNNFTLSTDNVKGTGLGLLICKDFTEKNNGEIFIESTEGFGTTVTIRIASAV